MVSKKCPRCNGDGHARMGTKYGIREDMLRNCPRCKGLGWINVPEKPERKPPNGGCVLTLILLISFLSLGLFAFAQIVNF